MNVVDLEQILRELERASQDLGGRLQNELEKTLLELRLRHFYRCLPNKRLKTSQLIDFLTEVLNAAPSEDLVDRIKESERTTRISDEAYENLERRQNMRCAICGRVLNKSAKPHVDHIVPYALRGQSVLENFQLLCDECNVGKSANAHWIMARPLFQECYRKVSFKMRYCVMSRDASECTETLCGETSYTSQLFVIPIVPPQNGGRLIFDNLRTVCDAHRMGREDAWFSQARVRFNAMRAGIRAVS